MMPMEIVRKSISFPKELADKILERAKEGNRSFSAQVVYDMNTILNMVTTLDLGKFGKPYGLKESSIETEE